MTRMRTGPSKGASNKGASNKGASNKGASTTGGAGKGRPPGARARTAGAEKSPGANAAGIKPKRFFAARPKKARPEDEAVDPARAARLVRESAEKFHAAEAKELPAPAPYKETGSANPARYRGRGRHAHRSLVQAAHPHAFAVASGENLPQGRGPAERQKGRDTSTRVVAGANVRVPPLSVEGVRRRRSRRRCFPRLTPARSATWFCSTTAT